MDAPKNIHELVRDGKIVKCRPQDADFQVTWLEPETYAMRHSFYRYT